MKCIAGMLGIAVVGVAMLPALAQAQVIVVQPGRVYLPPAYVNPPVVTSSYYLAPSVTSTPTYSYYAGPSVVTYSSPAPVITYSAPTAVYLPLGHYETRSYYGFGIFRPRGWTTESYWRP